MEGEGGGGGGTVSNAGAVNSRSVILKKEPATFVIGMDAVKPWLNELASSRKLNFRRVLRWVAKRTREFPRKYTQVAIRPTHDLSNARRALFTEVTSCLSHCLSANTQSRYISGRYSFFLRLSKYM